MKRSKMLKLLAVALVSCAATVFAADPAPIKGNPESKIYHKPECRYYNAKSCTVVFKTEAEAVKAGYKPCKKCAVTSTPKPIEKQPSTASADASKSTE